MGARFTLRKFLLAMIAAALRVSPTAPLPPNHSVGTKDSVEIIAAEQISGTNSTPATAKTNAVILTLKQPSAGVANDL